MRSGVQIVVIPLSPRYILAADWSKDPRKRKVYLGDCEHRSIGQIEHSQWTLAGLIDFAESLTDERRTSTSTSTGSVLIGIDVALGVSIEFLELAVQSTRTKGVTGFLDWLTSVGDKPEFWEETSQPTNWSPKRPFIKVPAGKGGLQQFSAIVELRRKIDRESNAKSPLIVSGIPGVVGGASREVWRELFSILEKGRRGLGIWPFEKQQQKLASCKSLLAEVYPAICYGLAIGKEYHSCRLQVAKTSMQVRKQLLNRLLKAEWVGTNGIQIKDHAAAISNEDCFDALMVCAAILRLRIAGTDIFAVNESSVSEGRAIEVRNRIEGDILLSRYVDLQAAATKKI